MIVVDDSVTFKNVYINHGLPDKSVEVTRTTLSKANGERFSLTEIVRKIIELAEKNGGQNPSRIEVNEPQFDEWNLKLRPYSLTWLGPLFILGVPVQIGTVENIIVLTWEEER